MQLTPMMGHKKYIPGHYLDYVFYSHGADVDPALGHLWELPSMPRDPFALHLKFDQVSGSTFAMSLIKKKSFILNGSKVFSAELKLGDQIILGHNVIKFLEYKQQDPLSSQSDSNEEALAESFWSSPLHLLIEGETGVGKTRLAKKIYEHHQNVKKWCHINLSSFSPSLMESELFGHVKGSFTGALNDKKGALEDSHQGLLFLDEIDSLPSEIQVKLLLFLDDQTFRPVGSNMSKKIKTKIIFASGRPLLSLVEAGIIRKDFYFRLASGLKVQLKSLKEDKDLIAKYVMDFCQENSYTISAELLTYYKNFSWPGNFRQLKDHLIKKSISAKKMKMRLEFDLHDEGLLLSGSKLSPINSLVDGKNHLLTLDEIKNLYTQKIFHFSNGDWQQTADVLGISKKTVKTIILGETGS